MKRKSMSYWKPLDLTEEELATKHLFVSTPDFRPTITWTPEPLRRKLADRRRPEPFKSSIGIISDRRKHDRRAR